MKVNRSRFSKIKTQWDITKMKLAYIEAEKAIMQNPHLTGYAEQVGDILEQQGWSVQYKTEMLSPEEFNNRVANVQDLSIKDIKIKGLEAEILNLENLGREALAKEEYLMAQEAKELWEKAVKGWEKLSGKTWKK